MARKWISVVIALATIALLLRLLISAPTAAAISTGGLDRPCSTLLLVDGKGVPVTVINGIDERS